MAIAGQVLLLASSLLRSKTLRRSSVAQPLVLFGILLSAFSQASAQTPSQQYVYLSVPTTPPSAVSGFSKSGQTGTLSLVPTAPFNERLDGGLVAIDGQGKFLFVLNPASNDISMFQIDPASGVLSEVQGSPFAVPPTINPAMAPSHPISIAAESSGKFLFVGYFSGDIQGQSSVASLAIDTSGPSPVLITQQSTPTASLGAPTQLLTDPKGLHLYVGLRHGQNGLSDGGAEVYAIDSFTGKLAYQGMASVLNADGLSYAIDPGDRFFYAGGQGNVGPIESCVISPLDGTADGAGNTCQPIFFLGQGNYPSSMVAESSGLFLYIAQSGGVEVYSVDQVSGALNPVLGPLGGIFFGQGSAVADPMGPFIYSADFAVPASIHAYQVDRQTGNLTEISGSPFSSGVTALGCCGGLAISGNLVQAITGPAVSIFPATVPNFGAVVGSSSFTHVVYIINVGDQLLAVNSISLAGTNASSFSQTNTCLATLAPNANCSVSIIFTPPSVGTFSASLQVADNAPGSPQTLALFGTGIAPAPAVTFSPASPTFPTTTQGTSSVPQTLTVISSGNAPLHVSSVSLAGPNPSDFSLTNNCTAPLAPASNCAISLVFNPIAPGQRTASLMISDDAPGSPQTVSLSATANPAFSAGAAPGGSTSASVSAGQPAQFQLQLTSGAGFSGTVSLTCAGAPLGAVCQVPSSISLSNAAVAPFTVTVTTSGPAVAPPSAPIRFRRIPAPPVLPFLAFALLFFLFRNYRSFPRALGPRRLVLGGILSAAILGALLSTAGCGGGSAAVAPPPIVTPTGNSTIVINFSAMSSSGQSLQLQPIQLTLTVK
jgi:6-phosphogluconolactonase (cycloisomerase 2 family)